MGSIYLIRHGQASFGTDDYDVLSPIGVRQSQCLGTYLAQVDVRLDRCLSGSLRRQRDTATHTLAQLHASGLPAPALEQDAAFDEFDADAIFRALLPDLLPNEPQALEIMRNAAHDRARFQHLFERVIERWLEGRHNPPGLTSWQAFVAQVDAGLQRLLASSEGRRDIALFTSGGTITALLHLITGLSPAAAFELNWQIVNTSLSGLKFHGSRVSLSSFNSHAHLQLSGEPSLITYR